jgi:hypothetical protein
MPDNPSSYDGNDRREPSLLPWWVRAIAVIGIPGAIAVYLVFVGATEIPKIKTEITATRVEVLTLQKLMYEHIEQDAALHRMLQRICSNTAKNEDAKQRCFDR